MGKPLKLGASSDFPTTGDFLKSVCKKKKKGKGNGS
jgi:hypothetical protein